MIVSRKRNLVRTPAKKMVVLWRSQIKEFYVYVLFYDLLFIAHC